MAKDLSTPSFEVPPSVLYTIWYSLDGVTWKPINSDVVSDSAGQMWLIRAHVDRYAEDLRSRGYRCRIAVYDFADWEMGESYGSEQEGEAS